MDYELIEIKSRWAKKLMKVIQNLKENEIDTLVGEVMTGLGYGMDVNTKIKPSGLVTHTDTLSPALVNEFRFEFIDLLEKTKSKIEVELKEMVK